MRDFLFWLCLAGLVCSGGAQEGNAGSYLLPQIVFVGDQGRLVYPLASDFPAGPLLSGDSIVLDMPEQLPQSPGVVISRVELEVREGHGARLLVDFKAYVPGRVELPPIKIGPHTFTGLEFTVTSILRSGMTLSGPADPLAVPGTLALIYGAVLGIITLILLAAAAGVWGRRRFRDVLERSRRRRLIRAMGRNLKRLRTALTKGASGDEEILSFFSAEFRKFLGFFAEKDCRAMAPSEFLSLFPQETQETALFSGRFLCDLFRRCDILRFSGNRIDRGDVIDLVETAGSFVDALGRSEKEGAA
jgi:hypothetical protein